MNITEKNHFIKIKDPGSAITHFIGFIMASVATPFLIGRCIENNDTIGVILASIIFCISMMGLYIASTIYHILITESKIPKKIDHIMICYLIAGTYTPICISLLGKTGIMILAAVWTMAILATIFVLFYVTCPKWISSTIYLMMGWVVIFALPTIIQAIPTSGFVWLLTGGLFYSIGAIIYALKLKIFNSIHPNFGSHEIFHIFVMLGTLCHYIFIYFYVI